MLGAPLFLPVMLVYIFILTSAMGGSSPIPLYLLVFLAWLINWASGYGFYRKTFRPWKKHWPLGLLLLWLGVMQLVVYVASV